MAQWRSKIPVKFLWRRVTKIGLITIFRLLATAYSVSLQLSEYLQAVLPSPTRRHVMSYLQGTISRRSLSSLMQNCTVCGNRIATRFRDGQPRNRGWIPGRGNGFFSSL